MIKSFFFFFLGVFKLKVPSWPNARAREQDVRTADHAEEAWGCVRACLHTLLAVCSVCLLGNRQGRRDGENGGALGSASSGFLFCFAQPETEKSMELTGD